MNGQTYRDLEGLRAAAEIEKRGWTLYRHAMRISQSSEAKALLQRLADDEEAHRVEFLRLCQEALDGLDQTEDPSAHPEQAAMLSATAADVVFPGGLVRLGLEEGFDDLSGILRHSIKAENDSIIFFSKLIKESKCEAIRRALAKIVQQELGHLQELNEMLAKEQKEALE